MYIVNRQQLKLKMDRNEFQAVVEVLDSDSYESFHLPNAVNVPLDDGFAERLQSIAPDKSRPVAVYCSGGRSNGALKASRKMQEMGYQQVYYYEDGKQDWKDAGLPVETYTRTHDWSAVHHPL